MKKLVLLCVLPACMLGSGDGKDGGKGELERRLSNSGLSKEEALKRLLAARKRSQELARQAKPNRKDKKKK